MILILIRKHLQRKYILNELGDRKEFYHEMRLNEKLKLDDKIFSATNDKFIQEKGKIYKSLFDKKSTILIYCINLFISSRSSDCCKNI